MKKKKARVSRYRFEETGATRNHPDWGNQRHPHDYIYREHARVYTKNAFAHLSGTLEGPIEKDLRIEIVEPGELDPVLSVLDLSGSAQAPAVEQLAEIPQPPAQTLPVPENHPAWSIPAVWNPQGPEMTLSKLVPNPELVLGRFTGQVAEETVWVGNSENLWIGAKLPVARHAEKAGMWRLTRPLPQRKGSW